MIVPFIARLLPFRSAGHHAATHDRRFAAGVRALPADSLSYEDLYQRWESSHWSAHETDFSRDVEDWRRFDDFERRAALWHLAPFLYGEDAVTDALTVYVDAAPREEQKYFLATQLVDEARHSVFFARFMREVAGSDAQDMHELLGGSVPGLTWGFRRIFERLERMVASLRRDHSPAMLAGGVTLYHMMIEAGMAQPAQICIERFLASRGVLPGLRAGLANIARDEQRHIGFGVKLLADLMREHPECREAITDMLRESNREAMAAAIPPGWDRRYTEVFGYTLEDLYHEGSRSLDSKLRAAGLPPEEMPGVAPFPPDMTPDERAERGLALVRAGVLGEKEGPPPRDAATVAIVFDTLRRNVNPDHGLRNRLTIAWDFEDTEPWHLTIPRQGAPESRPGLPPRDGALVLGCRYEDWVDVMAGRVDPRRLLLTRRLRPRGRVSQLRHLSALFA